MERRYEVRPYGVRYICDACGRGEMLALQGTQAYVQEAGRILIRHVCSVCHTLTTFPDKYPTVRHEDIPGQAANTVPGYTVPAQPQQMGQPIQQFQQPQQQQPTMQQPVQSTMQQPVTAQQTPGNNLTAKS